MNPLASGAGTEAGGSASGGHVALLFPGQGAQSVGMAGDWCDAEPAAAELFRRAGDILGYDLLALCRNGPAAALNTTAVSQPAILVTSLAALEVLRSRSAREGTAGPDAAASITAGLSLGEYTALVFAGAIDFDDAVRLVDIRGRAMQECSETQPGRMVAVLGLDRDRIATLCDGCRGADVLEIANVLCPGNIVVSGSAEACRRLEEAAAAAGAMKCVGLDVAGAFHTSLMQPAVARLGEALARVTIRPPRLPVVSNVDALPHADPGEIRGLLARQVVGVVEWHSSVAYLLSTGVRSVWEVGPGRVLRGLMKRIDRGVGCFGVFD
ncbi:MAG: [acyl-carrier-protein] S-malonyltransferase [Planctomycetia bacterium]|nr:[acyl-carrier-protein] S-malonyltransferase [Planctomycetia bacterium]